MVKKFPEYLHRPLQVLWWESDELGLMMLALVIGMVFEHIIFWIVPFLGVFQYGKIKKKYPRGFIKHLMYFIGLVKFKHYPDYWEEVFQE